VKNQNTGRGNAWVNWSTDPAWLVLSVIAVAGYF
jgi:hypothetical protein